MTAETIRCVERGRGFPVILGHGLCLDHAMWAPQMEPLARSFHAIAVDFPGHGQSHSPEEGCTLDSFVRAVLRLADRLDAERFAYAGLSMGGMVGMRLALAAPERLAALALLATDAEPDPPDTLRGYRKYLELYRSKGPTDVSLDKQILHFLTPRFIRQNPGTAALLRARLASNDRTSIYRASLAVFNRESVLEALSKIDVPTLVIAGTDDVVMPPERLRKIHRAIAGSQYVEVPECGHLSTLVQPERVSRELVSFFERTLPC